MKHALTCIMLAIAILLPSATEAQFVNNSFHQRNDFLLTSPGAMKFGLYGYDNPALLGYIEQPDLLFQFSDQGGFGSFNRYGVFTANPLFGFSAIFNDIGPASFRSYSFGAGFGNERGAIGYSFNWYGGNAGDFGLENHINIGTVSRPNRYFSLGLMGSFSVESADYEGVVDVAVRPLGTPAVALFGDYAVQRNVAVENGTWSGGLAFEPVSGVRVTGRYIHDFGVTAGLQFSFGRAGVSAQSHFDTDVNQQFNTYGIRLGAYDRNVFDTYRSTGDRYLNMSLRGPMAYQNRRFFDNRNTLRNTLETIRNAKDDPRISGIAINTTGMAISSAMIWEIRDELERFKESGKKVVMYIERGSMSTLHLASVADYVVMDPFGGLTVTGYASSTTYLKDLLDYYGIGVDEFREMTHKSAFESFARSDGSEEDREQREDLINGYYEVTRNDVMAGRGLSEEEFDDLINRGLSLLPEDLVKAGIVDTLARSTEINDIIRELEGRRMGRTGSSSLLANIMPNDDFWGPKPEIAIIYAIGGTTTEGGIQARRLASDIRAARNNSNVKAIILRADSPGGDPLASDLVAEELRKTMEKKPVIVSMGNVAASGGYWISMYSDTIIAVPNTVTGSIGVISGWFYDDGLSDRLRLNYRTVSRGESADLMGGPVLPLIGLGLPGRNLTESEREGLINRMLVLYDQFIEKVAEGRDMEEDEVRAVAEGRVWTGIQAKENGLVDDLGSLSFAIALAMDRAGMSMDEPYQITERPTPSAFDLFDILPVPSIIRAQFATEEEVMSDPMVDYLKMMINNNGYPSVALPMEYYQLIYQLTR